MLLYAKEQFEFSIQQIGGISKRAHLESIARQTGREVDEHETPYDLSYLWVWWYELHQGARESGIDYNHILAWCLLTHITLSHFELSVIMRIDQVFLSVVAEQQKGTHG